jgi:hypothetical protein
MLQNWMSDLAIERQSRITNSRPENGRTFKSAEWARLLGALFKTK